MSASKNKRTEIKDTIENRDRIHMVMVLLTVVFIAFSVGILICIGHIQATYSVPAKVINLFRPRPDKYIEQPKRGRILAEDGRPLAITTPLYDIYMDCTVRKSEFEEIDRKEARRIQRLKDQGKEAPAPAYKGAAAEKAWRAKADTLSRQLARLFPAKTASQYYTEIIEGRDNGKKHVLIRKNVSHATLNELHTLPLFNEGKYRGGLIAEEHDERIYPYDTLARRVIGYVRETNRIGIEGTFDYELHGTEGVEWRRVTDDNKYIRDFDSTMVKAVDGNDVRTTLNIDFQDIADRALRRQISEDPQIRAGIAVLMEVKTGAIRAMVNLSRDTIPGSKLWERDNLVLKEVGEQGSVMKTVTLLSLVEDGYVTSLEQPIPTHHGVVPGYNQDTHILDYERLTGRSEITVKHGFEISSNYVFTYLPETYYGAQPQEFFDHIYAYRLGEKFDFDLDGLGTPVVNRPGTPGWSRTTLGTTAYGYGMSVTPLHVVTFYNAIANKGRMMKPYVVESVEKDGKVLKEYGPSVLNNICTRATADTVTRALKAVVDDGTATRLKNAKLSVAGKTGTAQVVLTAKERKGNPDPYHDPWGRKRNQGTFVGFFPADDPKYTILVTVYSYLSGQSFYGGTKPAMAVREIVDNIYAIDDTWSGRIASEGTLPTMEARTASADAGKTPDVKGFGLMDAMYAVENAGYKCVYEGSGHVTAQSPAAGTALKKGETIRLTLK
ncbi:MAG: transpeptidase family protein [Bacteroidales bacterium]|nr:transpeptidase family protein [Bacteroidales bacterium]